MLHLCVSKEQPRAKILPLFGCNQNCKLLLPFFYDCLFFLPGGVTHIVHKHKLDICHPHTFFPQARLKTEIFLFQLGASKIA